MLFKLLFLHLRSTKLRFSFLLWKLCRTINQFSLYQKRDYIPQWCSVPPGVDHAPHARRLDGWCIISRATHTHTGKISESLFVLLQRWTGQAWAVTLEHPWLHSFLRVELEMTRTSAAECPGHAAVENVIANVHLASVASAKQSKTHSTRRLAASQPRSLAASVCPSASRRLSAWLCLPVDNINSYWLGGVKEKCPTGV